MCMHRLLVTHVTKLATLSPGTCDGWGSLYGTVALKSIRPETTDFNGINRSIPVSTTGRVDSIKADKSFIILCYN